MTDIVERLRLEAKQQKRNGIFPSTISAMLEAAHEIELLRRENEELRGMQARWTITDHHNMTQAGAPKRKS